MSAIEETRLSSSVTIAQYREFEAQKDRENIADFIFERFSERYIRPLHGSQKHGFCMMAICCLMIEALESFYQGWPDTKGRSREAFHSFFEQCQKQQSPLGDFAQRADDFYEGVRCGILHQAETTRGWRILRKGPLYDPETKTINATKFLKELEAILKRYCDALRNDDWESDLWQKCRNKMEAVIENCVPR
ncbi:hypothetical protein [Chloroflexus sp.]|uniref:hypothetical protein n=1 Tax=Chloroflexus sp. TaxID=1904827 RepID=UPI00298F322C|nr:hypothetical protein [Chloroflexus sp.]MDW8404338.1 hypothetical protein [Chloroflexus sp.]